MSESPASDEHHATVQHLVAGLLDLHADRLRIAAREAKLVAGFATTHPEVATVAVPALAGDVHDLDGLREIGNLLAAER